MDQLHEWDSFYVVAGSAAAALIGLQFVMMTLMADRPPKRAAEVSAAFATPTIVHFGVVVLLSGLLLAPWQDVVMPATLWGITGLCGCVYVLLVARRMRGQSVYQPVLEDWIFHAALPFLSHAALMVSAMTSGNHEREALFVVGAASMLLLFVGIHNAWDSVSYHVLVSRRDQASSESDEPSPEIEKTVAIEKTVRR